MEHVYAGAVGVLLISDAELYIDNRSRGRSGHMTHAMAELAPGKIIAFNSNCSAVRGQGHSAFGWVEFRYSEDGGKNWSESFDLEISKKILLDGVYSISVEKAVYQDGVLTCFLLRNHLFDNETACEPWGTPLVIRSTDGGKNWEDPVEFSPYPGRIYDAVTHDGVIYALETCDPRFFSEVKTDRYRLFASRDNGRSFQEMSVVDLDSYHRGYGALLFRQDGSLLAYACNITNGKSLDVSLSRDNGKSWTALPAIQLKHGMRNVQICPFAGGYVMHGRAWSERSGQGQVIYTSSDGLNWDDGILLETEKKVCYYSNMLPLKDADNREYILLQYSDLYADDARVNVMHRFLSCTPVSR